MKTGHLEIDWWYGYPHELFIMVLPCHRVLGPLFATKHFGFISCQYKTMPEQPSLSESRCSRTNAIKNTWDWKNREKTGTIKNKKERREVRNQKMNLWWDIMNHGEYFSRQFFVFCSPLNYPWMFSKMFTVFSCFLLPLLLLSSCFVFCIFPKQSYE